MAGEPIVSLGEALTQFLAGVDADEYARDICEIALVRVGGDVRIVRPFAQAREGMSESLDAGGCTPMGEAVMMAIDLVEERMRQYGAKGIRHFPPWLVILTDGQPTDATSAAEERVARLVAAKMLTVFPVAIGRDADLARLRKIAGGTPPARLAGLDFQSFFRWLTASVSAVLQSSPGDRVPMPSGVVWSSPDPVDGRATLPSARSSLS